MDANKIEIPTDRFPNCYLIYDERGRMNYIPCHYVFWVFNGNDRFPWDRPNTRRTYPVGAGQATLDDVVVAAKKWVEEQSFLWDEFVEKNPDNQYVKMYKNQ